MSCELKYRFESPICKIVTNNMGILWGKDMVSLFVHLFNVSIISSFDRVLLQNTQSKCKKDVFELFLFCFVLFLLLFLRVDLLFRYIVDLPLMCC